MIRFVFFSFFCFVSVVSAFSQVSIKEDFPIDQMMAKYLLINNEQQFVDGWRIQIIAKTDRQSIEQAKDQFMREFPKINVDWSHSKPYYRLRAGAFRTKLEAIRMIQRIKTKYPGAFPAKDNVSKQELLPEF